MVGITDSAATNRLIMLLMMLPPPHAEDTFAPFWDRVADDLGARTDYVTGKIAVHLSLLLGTENPVRHRERLASYALNFFGTPNDKLVTSIATEVNTGAPNDTAGQIWVEELRTAAFAVMEESHPDERVHEAVASWVRFNR